MQGIWRGLSCLVVAAGLIGPARADDRADCRAMGAPEVAIAACTRLIGTHAVKGPQLVDVYAARAKAYRAQADLDRAIADFNEAIRLDPARPFLFELRGNAWHAKRDYPHAIADYDRALELNPRLVPAHVSRASVHLAQGDLDAAIADYQTAIEISPKAAGLYLQRGHAWRRKGDVARALADYSEALRIAPEMLAAHVARGITLEKAGDRTGARADYQATIAAEARGEGGIRAQATARARLAMLDSSELSAAPAAQNPNASALGRAAVAAAPVSSGSGPPPLRQPAAAPGNAVATVAPPPRVDAVAPSAAPGLRLALVIGNGAYANATPLPNPPHDAAAVAKVLRELGFEVIEGTNLDRAGMERLIREFLHKAPSARVTLLYYAGHGMQVDGKNYLVPIDAKLAAPSDLAFEMLELDKVLAGLDDEARANIIVLDACRDNPLARSFASKLGATRSAAVPAGLAAYATVGTGTLIAFATAPGQTALDGSDGNSPFTAAFIKHVRTRGIEVNQMLTRVRVEVASATKNRQVPWANSSLLGEVYLGGEH